MPDHSAPAFICAWLTSSDVPAIAATIAVYLLACWIHQRCSRNPLTNPVAIAVLLLTGLLKLAAIPYHAYFEHARLIHFLLGPAIVAFAVPLHRQLHNLREAFVPLVFGLLAGSCVAVVSAMAIAVLFGCQPATVASLAPKSVTAAIAMLICAKVGGMPALTTAIVIATGISGAAMGPSSLACSAYGATTRAGSPLAWRRTASARLARSRSARKRVRSPGSAWR